MISGLGGLRANGRLFENVAYFIEALSTDLGGLQFEGMLDAAGDVLAAVRTCDEFFLILPNGDELAIIMTGTSGGHIEFRIFGPVPGFSKAIALKEGKADRF